MGRRDTVASGWWQNRLRADRDSDKKNICGLWIIGEELGEKGYLG